MSYAIRAVCPLLAVIVLGCEGAGPAAPPPHA